MLKLNVAAIVICLGFTACQEGQNPPIDIGAVSPQTVTDTKKSVSDGEITNLEKARERIRVLITARDLTGLINLLQQLPLDFKDRELIFLSANICGALNSYDFGDERQYLEARQCARRVLDNKERIPIDTELSMIGVLKGFEEYRAKLVPQSNWEEDRRQRVEYLKRLYQRVNAEIDRNYDPNAPENQGILNVPVPAPNYLPGMDPEQIKEPEVREKYKKAIQRNTEKLSKRNQQLELQQIDSRLSKYIETFLTQMYSIVPITKAAEAELTAFIRDFGFDSEAENRIYDQVRKTRH